MYRMGEFWFVDWVQGSTLQGVEVQWLSYGSGNVVDLSGLSLSGEMWNPQGLIRALTGSFEVLDAEMGTFLYTPSAADVENAGVHGLQFIGSDGGGGQVRSIKMNWRIKE